MSEATHEEELTVVPDSVLVVDDEPVVLQVLDKVLPRRGFVVSGVASAEEALARAQDRMFDCLLTDKNLPGRTGLELIAEFRELQPDCACIVMTGYASTASAVEALRLGANDYLEKPFADIELVAEKVLLAIQNHRALTDRAVFLRQLMEFRKELDEKESEAADHAAQIRMFNEILEKRVQQATADVRRERDALRAQLGAPANDRDLGPARLAKDVLEQLLVSPDSAPVRGEVQRALRHLGDLLRR